MSFFEVQLNRTQVAKMWRSEGVETSPKAAKLQALFDQGMSQQYEAQRALFEKQENGDAKFRITDGKVFELFASVRTIEVPIRFQVKGGTMTWYFIAPKDETHQSWRDELYMCAGIAHLNVDNHCVKYWRGSNSLHWKKMHTRESEDELNHSHYRLENDIDATPLHVAQHLFGFVEAQKEIDEARKLGVLKPSAEGPLADKFLNAKEAREISRLFNLWWAKASYVGEPKEISVEGEHLSLPARKESLIAAYRKSQQQTFTLEDKQEWLENKDKEEPCRLIVKGASIKEKMKVIKLGMRGIGSELANTRQVSWSKHPRITTVVTKDDRLGEEVPSTLPKIDALRSRAFAKL